MAVLPTSVAISEAPVSKVGQRFWRYATITAVLISVSAVAIAARNRFPWPDEGWFSSASHNLANHGFLGTTVLDSAGTGLTRIDRHTYWVMPVYLLGEALWYRIFPATMFFSRAFTIIWIPFALWGFFIILSRLADTGTARLGVCLLGLSFVFLDSAGVARPDFLCATLGIWGLAAYLALREKSLAAALFAGNALVAASGLTHPNGILHFCGLVTLVLWYDRRRLSVRVLAAAVAPYLLLGSGWLIYILQDSPAFLDQMRANAVDNDRWTNTFNPLLVVWHEIHDRYGVAFGFETRGFALLKIFALFAYLASVAGCLIDSRLRRQPSTRLLLMLLAVYFCAMSVFNQKLSYYLIHILPFYIALLAVWCVHLWSVYPRARRLVAAALVVLVSVETAGIVMKAHKRTYATAQRATVQYVLANTAPGSHVVGSAALLYEMRFDPRLCDDFYLGVKSGHTPDAIVIDRVYRNLYLTLGQEHPADLEKVKERLAGYRLAYRNGDYEVYFPQDRRKNVGPHPDSPTQLWLAHPF